ncbi:hypothetical protein OUZ56_033212 [Daphnia magna]|uniref:Uncharacterized protein n=1 Tax=Daphnia magna TaxID=35525 RepID=A0ABR0BAG4_9CRUS|nr:hypothetical protein OUZ56_033212 [Daphnia magna]
MFPNPCCEYRRFPTTDVQLFDELFNTVRSGVSCPDAPVSVVHPVWCNDFYYNEYPGYARLRDILPLLHARFLWLAESGDDIYHPSVSVSNIYPELTYSDIQIRLEHRQVRLAVLNRYNFPFFGGLGVFIDVRVSFGVSVADVIKGANSLMNGFSFAPPAL